MSNFLNPEMWYHKVISIKSEVELLNEIENRERYSHIFGPTKIGNENPSAIFFKMAAENNDFKRLLYSAINKYLSSSDITSNNTLITSILDIIYYFGSSPMYRNTNFRLDCADNLLIWLQNNNKKSISTFPSDVMIYKKALLILSLMQYLKPNFEKFWLSMWHEDNANYWAYAFVGLQGQTPFVLCNQIERLIKRAGMKAAKYLNSAYESEGTNIQLCETLKRGVKKQEDWAIIGYNLLVEYRKNMQLQTKIG